MSSDLTPAELTLLGLLVEKPRHGYELEEVIAARGMRDWTEIGFSSIYYLLGRLRDRGLIAEAGAARPARPARPAPPGRGKARKVYAPTAAGRGECAKAAEAAIADPRPVYPPVLVGLANQPVIAPERLHAALARRAVTLAERGAEIRRAFEAQPDAPEFVQAIFTYTLGQLAAEEAWLAGYRAQLTGAPDPGDT